MIRPKRLGETEQAWYIRAKAAVAKFGASGSRCYDDARLAGSLADLVAQVEASSPADYSVFASQDAKDAVLALEDSVRTMETSMSGASLGQDQVAPWLCAAAGLVIVGTIVYFAVKG
jgi:hypothetical protein